MGKTLQIAGVIKPFSDKRLGSPPSSRAADNIPKKLEFVVSPDTAKDIETAHSSLSRLTADLDLFIYKFKGYGKEFIKSCKLSPDSYVQMAMQLAYYKLLMDMVWIGCCLV